MPWRKGMGIRAGAVLVAVVPTLLGAQTTVVAIPDAPSCAGCQINMRKIAVLGASDGPGMLPHEPASVIVDGRGRYWVLPGDGAIPMVYDASGRFLREIGRRGEGPGEFGFPAGLLAIPGDSVVVIDFTTSRATVFGPDLTAARSATITQRIAPGVVLAWPAAVIMHGWVRTPERAGLPLHRASFGGRDVTLVHSFSADSGYALPGQEWKWAVRTAPGLNGSFWSYNLYRYRFTQWSASGSLLLDLQRRPEWFKQSSDGRILGNHQIPPSSAVRGLVSDTSGNLWLIAAVPAPNWRTAWDRVPRDASELTLMQFDKEALYHSMIEVVDPRARRVVARMSAPLGILWALPGPRAVVYEVDPFGIPRVVIYEMQLNRR